MLYLITYLEEVYSRKDIREANKQTFKLEDMMKKIDWDIKNKRFNNLRIFT